MSSSIRQSVQCGRRITSPMRKSRFFLHFYFLPASGQAVATGVVPSSPQFLPSIIIAHTVQQSYCSSVIYRVFLVATHHALALSASQFVHKKKSLRIYTSMHSGGLKLTKPTYTKLEDNVIRHRGARLPVVQVCFVKG